MSDRDEFFVGYLPTPPGLRRFLLGAVAIILVISAATAILIAARQRDPGSGSWDLSGDVQLSGILVREPYPMLQTGDGRMVLLVGEGKHSVMDRVGDASGRAVTLQGHLIQRNDWTMLELNDSPQTLQAIDPEIRATLPVSPTPGETRTFRGQIVDPKCFLGAMKPGEGKTHKACATLCLRGGIPPALVVDGSGDTAAYYLLVDSAGKPIVGDALERILPYVGDAVQLSGTPQQLGNLRLLRLDVDSIHRN
jgi:hypothetical protein